MIFFFPKVGIEIQTKTVPSKSSLLSAGSMTFKYSVDHSFLVSEKLSSRQNGLKYVSKNGTVDISKYNSKETPPFKYIAIKILTCLQSSDKKGERNRH